MFTATVGGSNTYNANEAMDKNGFLKAVPDPTTPNTSFIATIKNVNQNGNVITSSGSVATFPAVMVEIPIKANDLKFCYLYCGITTLGL